MIVHGLIDENVHFRHTARLINRLVSCGKDYELLLFPEERHSPRRLRDRIYMEQRIGDFFVRYLAESPTALDLVSALGPAGLRNLAGRL
jgi:dipeptidyl-peptidase-4